MTMLLRSDLLRPMDVVLLRSAGLESKGIKTVTYGPYSHAALVVSRTLRFESHDPGITFTAANYTHVFLENGNCQLYEDVSKYIRFDVFRHPVIAAMNEPELDDLQQRAVKITSRFNFAEYPSYEVFDKLVERHAGLDEDSRKAILRFLARNQNVIVPGPFCSQLVVEIYRLLKLRLFDMELPSEVISPNDLLDSVLRPVDGIVTHEAPEPNDANLLSFADRMAGRLDREPEEFFYTAVKLRQCELLRRTLIELVEDPKQRYKVDPGAVPAAAQAIADAYVCLQANDEAKVVDSIAREKRLFELASAGGDHLAAMSADAILGKPVERPEYKAETNKCFGGIRRIFEIRKPSFFNQ